ncbi:hypothetical protein [Cystobacter ferrugineus]|uniref:hypothetical protein n=1 Tax=Cystobacter ferrugineus TaxID=83449 RepID=UPI001161402D|nr:hypothetical protein [Cystobacter ferrugineus]
MAPPNNCNNQLSGATGAQAAEETEVPALDHPTLADSLRQLASEVRQLAEQQRETTKKITDSIDTLNAQLATLELQAGGPEPSAVSAEKAKRLLGCGRTKVFDLLKSGELQRTEKRHGSRTMITVDSIERAQQQRQPKKRRALKHGPRRASANLRKSIRTLPLSGDPDEPDDDSK